MSHWNERRAWPERMDSVCVCVDQVLQFAFDNKDEIIKQSRSNRITFLQNLVREKLNINLSLYMTGKVIQIIHSQCESLA